MSEILRLNVVTTNSAIEIFNRHFLIWNNGGKLLVNSKECMYLVLAIHLFYLIEKKNVENYSEIGEIKYINFNFYHSQYFIYIPCKQNCSNRTDILTEINTISKHSANLMKIIFVNMATTRKLGMFFRLILVNIQLWFRY